MKKALAEVFPEPETPKKLKGVLAHSIFGHLKERELYIIYSLAAGGSWGKSIGAGSSDTDND